MRFLTEKDYIRTDNLDKNLQGEWAVFKVYNGKKTFISSLYKEDLKWHTTSLKYSNEDVLKLNKEFALELANINIGRFDKYVGIVNDVGMQELVKG